MDFSLFSRRMKSSIIIQSIYISSIWGEESSKISFFIDDDTYYLNWPVWTINLWRIIWSFGIWVSAGLQCSFWYFFMIEAKFNKLAFSIVDKLKAIDIYILSALPIEESQLLHHYLWTLNLLLLLWTQNWLLCWCFLKHLNV